MISHHIGFICRARGDRPQAEVTSLHERIQRDVVVHGRLGQEWLREVTGDSGLMCGDRAALDIP